LALRKHCGSDRERVRAHRISVAKIADAPARNAIAKSLRRRVNTHRNRAVLRSCHIATVPRRGTNIPAGHGVPFGR
jgi:hypothetical protein